MIRPVWWEQGAVHFLDQRILPAEEAVVIASTCADVEEAIRSMVVRGAPAIGVSAAYGFVLAWLESKGDTTDFHRRVDALAVARPTAVNLLHAIKFMQQKLGTVEKEGASGDQVGELLLAEALGYHEADIAMNQEIGERGLERVRAGSDHDGPYKIITYCNTGSLATGGYGTALGVIRSLAKAKVLDNVYACETRPFLQGARLTAYELSRDELPYELITDNMAGWLMAQKKIDAIIVGADRIASNGDTANKIGTLQLAILARHYNVPFYVAAPTSTIDLEISDGSSIPVEQRDQDEVFGYGDTRWAPEDAVAWNPAFDVTPASMIHAIITETCVIDPRTQTLTDELHR